MIYFIIKLDSLIKLIKIFILKFKIPVYFGKFCMRQFYYKTNSYNQLTFLIENFKIVGDYFKFIINHFNTIKSNYFKTIKSYHFKILSDHFKIISDHFKTVSIHQTSQIEKVSP